MSPSAPGSTARTRVRRIPDKAVTDPAVLHAVLDAGLVAHVSVTDAEGQPYVVPVAYARDGDRVIFHGSSASRLFRGLAEGVPTCLTVTLLDGVVLARSAFESSMNFRSVMVLGTCTVLESEEKLAALEVVSEHLLPGQWEVIRGPLPKEMAATLVLALPLAECSVKVSAGHPDDVAADLADPVLSRVWGGYVPITESFGEPVADEHTPEGTPVPAHVLRWTR